MEKITIVLDRECAVRLRSIISERIQAIENMELTFRKNDIPLTDWMMLEKLQHHRILDAVEAAINTAE